MISIDKYGKVVKLLNDYKMRKISITNMKSEIEYLGDKNGLTGISYGQVGGSTNKITSTTEDTALRNVEGTEKLMAKIKEAELEIEIIDRALKGLNEIERAIIKGKYIENYQWWRVAYNVGYSERHCKRIRTEAIKKLIVGIYGQALKD